jgi:hypothetical protein
MAGGSNVRKEGVSSWSEIETAEREFASRVQARFDAYRHKVLATLRKDGSPRVSGIEVGFSNGEVWLGMMKGSLKARDLQRDPRLALHSGTEDPNEAEGMAGVVVDAKLSGRAIEVTDPAKLAALTGGEVEGVPESHTFRIDVSEVVLISIGDPADHLVIETWNEKRGLRSTKRY